jgi:predicted nucleic acid-binding protein
MPSSAPRALVEECGGNGARTLGENRFPTVPSLVLLDLAFDIASGFDRTVYDSLYLALALQFRVQLVTADEKLANAVAAQLPVK